jgi:hypothetical protein
MSFRLLNPAGRRNRHRYEGLHRDGKIAHLDDLQVFGARRRFKDDGVAGRAM